MQRSDEDVEGTIRRLVAAEPPSDMQARLVCSCRSRLYQMSCARRRNAVCLAAAWTLINMVLGFVAFSAHQKHARLRSSLYGG